MVRSKGLEPSRLLGTTTSRLRVYQFHHERIAGRGTWPIHGPIDKPFLPPCRAWPSTTRPPSGSATAQWMGNARLAKRLAWP